MPSLTSEVAHSEESVHSCAWRERRFPLVLSSMKKLSSILFTCFCLAGVSRLDASTPTTVIDLWPNDPPGPAMDVGPEQDFTKPTDRLIAGRRIIKLGNVKTPQIHVYRPKPEHATQSAVVICPGGGWSILAWDLEGTEVAEWFNSIGVTAVVLKYRVPTRQRDPRWLAPVQDAQRALRLTRFHASSWGISADRVGILGFSAGGHTAAMTALLEKAKYEAADKGDKLSCRPDFAALIYPGGLVSEDQSQLLDEVQVTESVPPVFFAHAFDDRVSPQNSLLFAVELKKQGVPCELHLYSEGGHGYGLRVTEQPVTTWHHACEAWMRINAWLD